MSHHNDHNRSGAAAWMFGMIAVVGAVVVIIVLILWMPWDDDSGNGGSGTGQQQDGGVDVDVGPTDIAETPSGGTPQASP